MRAEDLTVTVRDKALARIGVIPSHLLEATFIIRDTAVGDWKLRLPADHPMAALLRTPGYGIIVDGPGGTLFSGPMVKSTRDSDYRDESGIVTVQGVTDEIVLWDALAYPPAGFAYDTFTGEPWEIFDHFIDFNMGDLTRFPTGSFASLLTTDTSAVDGTGVNLIPNPEPTTVAGWSSSPAGTGASVDDYIITANGYSYYVASNQLSFKIFPVAAGTSAIAITPGTSYAVHVDCLDFSGNVSDLGVGISWYDEAGDALSTSTGTAVTATEVTESATWFYDGTTPVDYGHEGVPSGTFEAPVGAAYGRPWVEYGWTTSNPSLYRQTYTADFYMAST